MEGRCNSGSRAGTAGAGGTADPGRRPRRTPPSPIRSGQGVRVQADGEASFKFAKMRGPGDGGPAPASESARRAGIPGPSPPSPPPSPLPPAGGNLQPTFAAEERAAAASESAGSRSDAISVASLVTAA